MSSFYEFKLWLANFAVKHLPLFALILIIGVVTLSISLFSQVTLRVKVIGIIIGSLFILLYLLECALVTAYGSHNSAINEALKFQKMYPELRKKLSDLIRYTKDVKNPTKLREWIKNYKALSSAEANMQKLEKEKEEIEKGIPLTKINYEIEAEKERIKELESELA